MSKFLFGESKVVLHECHTIMIDHDMDILISWFMCNISKRINKRKIQRKQKGIKLVVVLPPMQGMMSMVVLEFYMFFLVKVHQMLLLGSTNRGCVTVSLKEGIIAGPYYLLILRVEKK